jgi:hypothetical protein
MSKLKSFYMYTPEFLKMGDLHASYKYEPVKRYFRALMSLCRSLAGRTGAGSG